MLLTVGSNDGFDVYFDADSQSYSVYKDGKFLIGNKYKFSEVKSYLDSPPNKHTMKRPHTRHIVRMQNVVQCDTPGCGYTVKNEGEDAVEPSVLEGFVNKPCPRCYASLCTEDDYKSYKRMYRVLIIFAYLFGWMFKKTPLDPSKEPTASIQYINGKQVITQDN